MNNETPVNTQQYPDFDFKNPLIAVSAILTLGICYCVTVTINAKYNRDIELSYKDFSLKSSSVRTIAVAPT